MAWLMKLKLPKFKVTHIAESNTRRSLPRGRKEAGSGVFLEHDLPTHCDDAEPDFHLEPSVPESIDVSHTGAGVSLHAVKQKATTTAWESVRALLRGAAIESCAMPISQDCIRCANSATHRCTQCGAWAYYCASCFSQAHLLTNFFHVGKVWEVYLLLLLHSWHCFL